ncbi:pentapeptide repeat-containing protein [Paenibacillus sp. FSL R5-0517]|uniref:pentapeptide repeat-containing protein n=1 Tax=Paenibacillus sp. FSL R5-0517 TaxID=2921647 RepID=UPI0030D81024
METLVVRKSIKNLNQSMKANWNDFFKSLGKATIGGVFLDSKEVINNSYEALLSLGLEKEVTHLAWLLIYRSLTEAIRNIVEESRELFNITEIDIESLSMRIDLSLENEIFEIDRNFFSNPKSLKILSTVKIPFAQWLDGFNLSASQITSITDRLPVFFTFALHEEWKARPEQYKSISEYFDSPFMRANERQLSWLRYTTYLRKETEKRMFDEAFSLRKIYVPLRAYYNKKSQDNSKLGDIDFSLPPNKKVVIDLEKELDNWLHTADKNDAIRVISGGPGSGKSSFAKIYSAKLAEKQSIPVLFIPLHHFELSDDLIEAVGRFVKYDKYLIHNPLDPQNGEERIIVFFDGLDELSRQGKLANEIARQFVEEVQRKVDRFNMEEIRIQVIMTGRELSIQQSKDQFRRPNQIFEILPYYISHDDKDDYYDPNKLLETDQRKTWWKLYGLASGQNFTSIPDTLTGESLEEITSQPLLNYLVALSFMRDKIDFNKNNNLNAIYNDLLQAVYERGWANNKHPSIKDTTLEQFIRILEVIAVSVWHGSGRTTTIRDIENYSQNNGLKDLLNRFQEGAANGVTRLLTAFYFRESGANNMGDNTFEFTHKSFGEYLASRRIILSLKHINKMLSRRADDPDDGWDTKSAVVYFINLCGSAKIDTYLINFIKGELDFLSVKEIQRLQVTLGELLNYCIKFDVPVDRLDPRPSFSLERIYSNNTFESLIILLSLASSHIDQSLKINWDLENSFGTILKMITGQRTGATNAIVMSYLRHLDISNQCLDMADLYRADLSYINFESGAMHYSNLVHSMCDGANFKGAKLSYSQLERTHFNECNMTGVYLYEAYARHAYFNWAQLEHATIYKTDFSNSNFYKANLKNLNNKSQLRFEMIIFSSTELEYTDFSNSSLRGCNFKNALLNNTNFHKANLSHSCFDNAVLNNVIFEGADLTKVDFEKVKFMENCNFEGSYCVIKHEEFMEDQFSNRM